jgi:hypothetical protein
MKASIDSSSPPAESNEKYSARRSGSFHGNTGISFPDKASLRYSDSVSTRRCPSFLKSSGSKGYGIFDLVLVIISFFIFKLFIPRRGYGIVEYN